MRYFVPNIRISEELPYQSLPEDKLGGLPWGIAPKLWPICRECGKSQSLLAQFLHHPERLDLGRSGRVLSVFQCNHDPGMCATWEGGSGANACFVTEPEELLPGLATLPSDAPLIEPEARIVEWIERDDGITEVEASKFLSSAFYGMDKSEISKVSWSTRLGGVPCWVQGSDETPQGNWQFVGQLDSTYSFIVPPLLETPGVVEDARHWEGRSHYCEGPNFGAGGIAYLFIRLTSSKPEGWFFWQCG